MSIYLYMIMQQYLYIFNHMSHKNTQKIHTFFRSA